MLRIIVEKIAVGAKIICVVAHVTRWDKIKCDAKKKKILFKRESDALLKNKQNHTGVATQKKHILQADSQMDVTFSLSSLDSVGSFASLSSSSQIKSVHLTLLCQS